MVSAALRVRKEVVVRDPDLGYSRTESGETEMRPTSGVSRRTAVAQTVAEGEEVHEEDLRDP
jgi:hypothetical protein